MNFYIHFDIELIYNFFTFGNLSKFFHHDIT